MDLKECYTSFGGDYEEVLGRLRKDQTVQKFMYKFLDDKSYFLLETSMETNDYDEAFRAAHTLKGICQNLSFVKLYESSSRITEALRSKDYDDAVEMMPSLSADYHRIIDCVKEYKSSRGE